MEERERKKDSNKGQGEKRKEGMERESKRFRRRKGERKTTWNLV